MNKHKVVLVDLMLSVKSVWGRIFRLKWKTKIKEEEGICFFLFFFEGGRIKQGCFLFHLIKKIFYIKISSFGCQNCAKNHVVLVGDTIV